MGLDADLAVPPVGDGRTAADGRDDGEVTAFAAEDPESLVGVSGVDPRRLAEGLAQRRRRLARAPRRTG